MRSFVLAAKETWEAQRSAAGVRLAASLLLDTEIAPVVNGAGDRVELLSVGIPSDRGSRGEGLFEDVGDVGQQMPVDIPAALEVMAPFDRLCNDHRSAQPAGLDRRYLNLPGSAGRVTHMAEPAVGRPDRPRQRNGAGGASEKHGGIIWPQRGDLCTRRSSRSRWGGEPLFEFADSRPGCIPAACLRIPAGTSSFGLVLLTVGDIEPDALHDHYPYPLFTAEPDDSSVRRSRGHGDSPTRLMKDARVRGSVPHVGLPAKLVDRGGHGKWVAWCRPGPRSRENTPGCTPGRRRRTRDGSLMRSAQSLAGVGTTRADAWWPQPSAHRVAESRRSAGLEPAGTPTTP